MSILLGLALLQGVTNPSATASATSASALCAGAGWRETFSEAGLECVPAQHGVVIAPAERARMLAPVVDAAAARHAAHFAGPGAPVVVVASSSVSGPQAQFLRQQGFLSLAWPAPSDPAKEATILSHELAHLWFAAWYDSERGNRTGPHYGSTAPDWLDEVAAILNEDAEGISERRAGLIELLRGNGLRLRPLAEFLNMAHPGTAGGGPQARLDLSNLPPGATVLPNGTVRMPAAPGSMPRIDPNNLPPGATRTPDGGIFIPARRGEGSGSFTTSQRSSDPATRRAMLPFYIQALALADFLSEMSGSPRIMMEVATAMRGGRSFEQWLGTEGLRHLLPADLTGLSTAWEAWLRRKAAARAG